MAKAVGSNGYILLSVRYVKPYTREDAAHRYARYYLVCMTNSEDETPYYRV